MGILRHSAGTTVGLPALSTSLIGVVVAKALTRAMERANKEMLCEAGA